MKKTLIKKELSDEKSEILRHENRITDSILRNSPQLFNKQSYTLRLLLQDIRYSRKFSHELEQALTQISHQLVFYMALTTTKEFGCPYCLWIQENKAPDYGCTSQTINAVKSNKYDDFPSNEIIALNFAKHYAESKRNPAKKEIKKLVRYFGKKESSNLINFLHLVSVGNLMGNTVDAFESRLKGIPVKNGSILFEMFIYLIGGFLVKRIMIRMGLKIKN
ncbi:MAG: hypothetical protein ACW967_08945 [Candidatus Hodarchaeales archaeon]|jgi:hypothetical protein